MSYPASMGKKKSENKKERKTSYSFKGKISDSTNDRAFHIVPRNSINIFLC